MFVPRFAILLSAIFAFGAGSALAQTPAVPVDTKSADYRTGFTDGCLHATDGLMRNERRFTTDWLYHEGWQRGFHNCYPHQTINTNGDPNGPLKNLF